MKSIAFVLLIVVIINSVFAQYNAPQQYNNAPQPQQYNSAPQQYNNAPQPTLGQYENEQAAAQNQMIPQAPQDVPSVPQTQPIPPAQDFQQTQPIPPVQDFQQTQQVPPVPQDFQQTQPVQDFQTQPVQQEVQQTQPIPPVQQNNQTVEQAVPGEEKESSSHAGTLAITGVAFALIAGVGYKNYRKDSKFKLPELPVIPGITTPKESASNEVVVEMEVLLSETSDAENYSLAKNRAYKCMVSWTPKQSDEIILRRGDLVCVKECFNDGYTLGRNLSTKFDGVFPTCCLCRPEQNIIGSELVKNGKFTAIPKRVSSKNRQERRARRASRGVSFLSSVPGWNKSGFSSLPQY